MSRFRTLLIALAIYGSVFTIARSYQAEILDWILESRAVSESPTLEGIVESITKCGQGTATCDCQLETCTQPRQVDLDSPYTLGLGVMVGSLVIMPFPPRYLVFLSVYARDRPVTDSAQPRAPPVAPSANPSDRPATTRAYPSDRTVTTGAPVVTPRRAPPVTAQGRPAADSVSTGQRQTTKPTVPSNISEFWGFIFGQSGKLISIAALALFFACMFNYMLGFIIGLFWAKKLQEGKWAKLQVWFDKLGLWIVAVGFLVPLGFPVSVFSCLAGVARTNIKRFALVCFIGSFAYFTELALIYPSLESVWNSGR